MSLPSRILNALLAISAYARPPSSSISLDSPAVESVREALGGNIQSQPVTQIRWYMSDLESARYTADNGDLAPAARLCAAMRGDGTVSGALSSLAGGLTRLPKQFRGHPDIVSELEQGHSSVRSLFDEMLPPKELEAVAGDFVLLNVAVGELLPVEGRDFPVFCRLDPQFLRYRWNEARWYFQSVAGPIPITPGDGRWVLFLGSRLSPWQFGKWISSGKSAILKWSSEMMRANWEAKLANPARVAKLPAAATDADAQGFVSRFGQWGLNTVFALRPGWDMSLLESKGTGHESFDKSIEGYKLEIIVDLLGQSMTTTGGEGFSNSATGLEVRADILQGLADGIGYGINTQVLPQFVVRRYGLEALETPAVMAWTTATAKDQNARASSLVQAAAAVKALYEALQPYGISPDVAELCSEFGVPVDNDKDGDGEPDDASDERMGVDVQAIAAALDLAKRGGLQATQKSIKTIVERVGVELEPSKGQIDLAPEDIVRVSKVDEARAQLGQPALGDDRGDLLIAQLDKLQPPANDGGEGDDGGDDGGPEGPPPDASDEPKKADEATVEATEPAAVAQPAQIDVVSTEQQAAGNWDDKKHPRGKGGKFAPKGSGGGGSSDDKDDGKEKAAPESPKKAAKKPTPKRKTAKRVTKKVAKKVAKKTAKKKTAKKPVAKRKTAKKAAKKVTPKRKTAKRVAKKTAKKTATPKRKTAKRAAKKVAKPTPKRKTAKKLKVTPPPKPRPVTPKPKPDPEPEQQKKPEPKLDSSKYDSITDKPEHTPKHWEAQYKHLGHAAKHAAYGHAMHERGLDMHPKDVVDTLAHLTNGEYANKNISFGCRLINRLISDGHTSTSVREMIERAPAMKHSLEAVAALAAHSRELRGKSMDVDVSFDASASNGHIDKIKEVSLFYASFAHKDNKFHNAYIEEGKGRAFYNPDPPLAKDKRPNAVCGQQDRPSVIAHELGHCLEEQPHVKKAAYAFLEARTSGDKLQKLSDLTGIKEYEDHEICRPDKFIDPYIGKEYMHMGKRYASEVVSMGVQKMFSDPDVLAAKDPEMFHFMLGVLGASKK